MGCKTQSAKKHLTHFRPALIDCCAKQLTLRFILYILVISYVRTVGTFFEICKVKKVQEKLFCLLGEKSLGGKIWAVVFIIPEHKIGTLEYLYVVQQFFDFKYRQLIQCSRIRLQFGRQSELRNGSFIGNVINFVNSLRIKIICLNSSYACKNQIRK